MGILMVLTSFKKEKRKEKITETKKRQWKIQMDITGEVKSLEI